MDYARIHFVAALRSRLMQGYGGSRQRYLKEYRSLTREERREMRKSAAVFSRTNPDVDRRFIERNAN